MRQGAGGTRRPRLPGRFPRPEHSAAGRGGGGEAQPPRAPSATLSTHPTSAPLRRHGPAASPLCPAVPGPTVNVSLILFFREKKLSRAAVTVNTWGTRPRGSNLRTHLGPWLLINKQTNSEGQPSSTRHGRCRAGGPRQEAPAAQE